MNIEFDQYQLENGLRVILSEDHSAPIVAVNIWYHVGSKNERKGRTGFAHLFEHMLFQGSEHVAKEQHFALLQKIGGVVNGSTTFDRTNYFETVPSDQLELALWLESDRMGFFLPGITQDKLNNQREVVKNERRSRYDNQPYGIWLEKILDNAFEEDFPYHWPVIGYMEDLDATGLEDVKDFFRTFYSANNAVLTVCGDFDIEDAKKLVENYFVEIPRGSEIPNVTAKFMGQRGGEKREVVEDDVQLCRIHFAYHIPAFGEKDWYTMNFLSDLISNGKSSRLYQSLVYELQVAKNAEAFVLGSEQTDIFIIRVTAKPGVHLVNLEPRIQNVIDTFIEKPVTERELQRTKNKIETRFISNLQLVDNKADLLSMYATFFNEPNRINTELNRLLSVSKEDIQVASKKYLVSDNRSVVTFVPKNSDNLAGLPRQ